MIYDRVAALLSYVPEYYKESKIYTSQSNVKGQEFNLLRQVIDDVLDQMYVETATWGLRLWEKYCGIPTNLADSLETRRARIIAKLSRCSPLTPYELKRLLSDYTNAQVDIKQYYSEYKFETIFKIKEQFGEKLKGIMDEIEEVKPAHLEYAITLDYLTDLIISNTFNRWQSEGFNYCGTIDVSGDSVISTKGWSFTEAILSKVSRYFSESFMRASETTYTYASGYTVIEQIASKLQRFFSEPFLICAEDSYSTGQGRSIISSINSKEASFLSSPLLSCSENLYSVGGDLVYDS